MDTPECELTSTSKARILPKLSVQDGALSRLADMTLESGDFLHRDFTEDRQGATHICRDWEGVYDVVSSN